MDIAGQYPKALLVIVNQVAELEQKVGKAPGSDGMQRNIVRIKDAFAELGLFYESPLGEEFSETRTDVEAHISGVGTENLQIIEVMKPVIRSGTPGRTRIVQRGVVVVQSKTGQ